jgi:hypothetical protein
MIQCTDPKDSLNADATPEENAMSEELGARMVSRRKNSPKHTGIVPTLGKGARERILLVGVADIWDDIEHDILCRDLGDTADQDRSKLD